MSEIKPCMNTECVRYGANINDGTHCAKYGPFKTATCPKYRSEPKPEPWQPLNPDEYEPGCTNEKCAIFNSLHNCNCSLDIGSVCRGGEKRMHHIMSEHIGCYRPKKKPETVKYAVIKMRLPDEKAALDGIGVYADCIGLQNEKIPLSTLISPTWRGITTCEIIEEEIK